MRYIMRLNDTERAEWRQVDYMRERIAQVGFLFQVGMALVANIENSEANNTLTHPRFDLYAMFEKPFWMRNF